MSPPKVVHLPIDFFVNQIRIQPFRINIEAEIVYDLQQPFEKVTKDLAERGWDIVNRNNASLTIRGRPPPLNFVITAEHCNFSWDKEKEMVCKNVGMCKFSYEEEKTGKHIQPHYKLNCINSGSGK